jgi:hypothetical protein
MERTKNIEIIYEIKREQTWNKEGAVIGRNIEGRLFKKKETKN